MAHPQSAASQKLGERIRDHRTALGLSQIDLWLKCGIHFTNIGKIERGEANPSLHTLIRLAGALEVDPGVLIQGLTTQDLPVDGTNADAHAHAVGTPSLNVRPSTKKAQADS